MTYARCFAPSMLEGVGRALYVDYDVLALQSIEPLLDTDLGEAWCGWCIDMSMMHFGRDELAKIGT